MVCVGRYHVLGLKQLVYNNKEPFFRMTKKISTHTRCSSRAKAWQKNLIIHLSEWQWTRYQSHWINGIPDLMRINQRKDVNMKRQIKCRPYSYKLDLNVDWEGSLESHTLFPTFRIVGNIDLVRERHLLVIAYLYETDLCNRKMSKVIYLKASAALVDLVSRKELRKWEPIMLMRKASITNIPVRTRAPRENPKMQILSPASSSKL